MEEIFKNLIINVKVSNSFQDFRKIERTKMIDCYEYFSEKKKKTIINSYNIIFPLITLLFTRSPFPPIHSPFPLSLSLSLHLYFPGQLVPFCTAIHKELNSPRGPRENSRGTTRVSRDLFLFTRSLRLSPLAPLDSTRLDIFKSLVNIVSNSVSKDRCPFFFFFHPSLRLYT